MTEAKMQDLSQVDPELDWAALPTAPLAMPKQVLETRPGGIVQMLLTRFSGLMARSQG